MSRSIYDIIKDRPDEWLRSSDFTTEEQQWDLDETGGMIKWCSTCKCDSSPNRPCFCGVMVLRREDGLYWGGENGWVEDWKYHAEHFFSAKTAKQVAEAIVADHGTISMFLVHTNWQEETAKEVVRR